MVLELNRKEWIIVGCVIVAILMIVIRVLNRLFGGNMRDVFGALGKVIQVSSGTQESRCPGVDDNVGAKAPIVLEFPLIWEELLGEFVISFEIGGQIVSAVVDTGSEYMVIGSTKCTGCEQSQGAYDTDSKTAIKCKQSTTVYYGSQVDNIDWYIDDFSPSGSSSGSVRIEFGAVSSVQSAQVGGSSLNIIGLASSTTFAEKTPFIDQLICTQQTTLAYMYFDFLTNDNKFVIGQPHPDASNGIVIPYYNAADVKEQIGMDFDDLNYYFLKPNAVTMNGEPLANAPKFIMFDTGTTVITFGQQLASQILRGDEGQALVFELDNGFNWTYVMNDSTMSAATGFGDDICIMGNQNMLDHAWSFDLGAKTLTIISHND